MKKNRPVNILLIEDNPGDIRLAQEAFKEGKIDVNLDVVMDGMEAIHFLNKSGPYQESSRPDLILLDLNLPKKDEELRKYFTTGYVLDEAEKIEAVVSIFRELKVAEAANQVKETYWQTALDALSKISSVGPKKTILEEFASALISRDF